MCVCLCLYVRFCLSVRLICPLDPPQFQLVKGVDLMGQSIQSMMDALMAQVHFSESVCVCLTVRLSVCLICLLDPPQFQLVEELDLLGLGN